MIDINKSTDDRDRYIIYIKYMGRHTENRQVIVREQVDKPKLPWFVFSHRQIAQETEF